MGYTNMENIPDRIKERNPVTISCFCSAVFSLFSSISNRISGLIHPDLQEQMLPWGKLVQENFV